MAKVTVFFDMPSINKYIEGDEEIPGAAVCSFDKAKMKILDKFQEYIQHLETMNYHDWKKSEDHK